MNDSPDTAQPPDAHEWADAALAAMYERLRKWCATEWRMQAFESLRRAAEMEER